VSTTKKTNQVRRRTTTGVGAGKATSTGATKATSRPVTASSMKGDAPSTPVTPAAQAKGERAAPSHANQLRTSSRVVANRKAQVQRERNTISFSLLAVVLVVIGLIVFANRPPASSKSGAKPTAATTGTVVASTNCQSVDMSKFPPIDSSLTVPSTPTDLGQCLFSYDLKVGTGQAVSGASDTITANYIGWLSDGTKFDASADHSGPAQFSLGQVIPGWTQGLVGMKVGGVRRLVIPPALGYGSQGSGSTIPPNSTLVFDVQLVSIP
jgi:FKBP-type peptidyl-prolyl cis-trans isomerase